MLNPSSFITAQPLDDFSLRYGNSLDAYVAQKLFTPHIVSKKTGQFYSYSKDNLRVKSLEAPYGTEAVAHEYAASKKTFTTVPHAVKQLVLGSDARDFDRAMADLDQEAAMQNMDALMLELETDAYTKATTSGNYPSGLVTTLTDGTNGWDVANSDPMENIRASREATFLRCGKNVNKAFMSKKTLDFLKLNPAIVDRIKYTGQEVTADILKMLFELDEICISDAIKNTALEGAADVLARVWGDQTVLAYIDPAPKLKSMTYGKLMMVNRLYSKTIDQPDLGRDLDAHYLETGWDYCLESAATASSSDDDFVAGALIINCHQ